MVCSDMKSIVFFFFTKVLIFLLLFVIFSNAKQVYVLYRLRIRGGS